MMQVSSKNENVMTTLLGNPTSMVYVGNVWYVRTQTDVLSVI